MLIYFLTLKAIWMGISDLQIAIECWADTILVETLVPPEKRGYSHFSSCFHVEAAMKNGKLKDVFAVGIIDDDKNSIKYLSEFQEWKNIENSLKLWVHSTKHHYFIQFSPAIEKWILKVCSVGGIDLQEFGLENDLTNLTSHTKHLASKQERANSSTQSLKNLFKKLKNRDDIEEVRLLKAWLMELRTKNYQIDKETLKNV